MEKKPERLRVRKPSDTDTVKWFRKTYKNIEYGTKKYDVQVLKAMGKNEGVLVTGRDNEEFFSGQQKIIKGVSELVSIYAQKLVALIPIVTWLPYELSFANTEKDVVNSSYVTHRSVSTIEFTYVKESGLPNSCYILTRNSNRIQIATLAHGAGVSGSKPFTYAKKKIGTIKSKSFGNRLDAIKKYSEKISYYDYVPCYTIYSYDKKYSSKYYVPNPLAPGGIC